jgi:hypothetical protein
MFEDTEIKINLDSFKLTELDDIEELIRPCRVCTEGSYCENRVPRALPFEICTFFYQIGGIKLGIYAIKHALELK